MQRVSGLGRSFSFSYPQHRIVGLTVAVAAVLALATAAIQSLSLIEAALRLASAAAGSFAAWAIAREIDPDRPNAAHIGAGLTGIAYALADTSGWLWWALVVVQLRVVNRSTGLRPRLLDLAGLVGLSAWIAFAIHPVALGLSALAILLDGALEPASGLHRRLGSLLMLGTVVSFVLLPGRPVPMPALLPYLFAFAVESASFLLAQRTREVQSEADSGEEQMRPQRVRSAQLFTGAWLVVLTIFLGEPVIRETLPVTLALVGVLAARFARRSG